MGTRFADMGDDSGSALIELAIGLTVCVTLIIGAAEFGRLAYASIEISNAAHAGAAYGAQTHTSASDTSGMQAVAALDGPNVTALSATASHFCSCSNGSTSTCAATDCASSRIIEYVQVNTTGTVDPYFHVPGLPKTYTLTGKAVMRVVQ
jgi:Flp pilus assembly protein TadG